jgi:aryl-alcohol dehydrogenase-like predicted oxidoreductase
VLELAVGWLSSQSHVSSVISGATTAEQVDANASAVEWVLTAEEVEEVAALVG